MPNAINRFKLSLVFIFFFTLNACSEAPSNQQSQWGAPVEASVVLPLKKSVVETDEYTGRFQASKRVDIRARVSGYLQEVKFSDGQLVEEGDVLFVIDQRPFEIEQSSAKARYELAQRELERVEGLRKSRAISEEEYDQRVLNARVEKSAYDAAQLNLEFTLVRAPIAGRVSRTMVDAGNLVSGGNASATLLTTLVQTTPIAFYFESSEADVLKYIRLYDTGARSGERGTAWPVAVQLQDEKDFPHQGKLDFVDNELAPDTGTMELRATFDNPNGFLEPGLFGRLRITTTSPFDALLIPDQAIGTEQTRKYVYVVGAESKAVRKYLELGSLNTDGLRIVRSGLNEEDQVIIGNLQKIQPGGVVVPVLSTEEPPTEELRTEDETTDAQPQSAADQEMRSGAARDTTREAPSAEQTEDVAE